MHPSHRPVLLQPTLSRARATWDDRTGAIDLDDVVRRAEGAVDDLAGAVTLARSLGRLAPLPGAGSTRELWELLATVASCDLTVARVLEPHLDALAILDQAGGVAEDERDQLWGVYAAEGPPPRLTASSTTQGWQLDGRKHWCSLAEQADRALISAWIDDDRRQLFAVDLHAPGVKSAAETPWVARGLSEVTSTALDLDAVPATAVGEPGWYLERPGFAWGGMGVAAVWFGGAVGIARRMAKQADQRALDQIGQMHLGAVEAALASARALLREAATAIDEGNAFAGHGAQLALVVRQVVRRTAEEVLRRADHALGPGPRATEADHAARTADLELYLRQEHAERDQAALGRWVLENLDENPW